MNRNLYKFLLLAAAFLPVALSAQMDTLLFEDFQDQAIGHPDDEIGIFPQGGDTIWVNFDADYLVDANDRPQNWFVDLDLFQVFGVDSVAAADSNFVLGSSSWLDGFLDGNRNWLITPPIQIGDDQATLHWKSAPRQGPRYMDGYSVLVSTTTNLPEAFTDTLLRVQQMLPPLPPGASDPMANAFNVDSFLYAPAGGYMHADRFTLEDYFFLEDSSSTAWIGILEPHSFSLEAYAGQTIYVAIIHDSDDDNYITIDDILVMGNVVSSAEEPLAADIRLVTYPNPADNFLNVLFRLETPASVRTGLFDMNGRQVLAMSSEGKLVGEQSLKLSLRLLPAGIYNLVLDIEGQQYSRKVVKR